MLTCVTANGTTKIYIFRLNLTGHFRSNEIKSAGTVLLNAGKICADFQRNFISARAQNYCSRKFLNGWPKFTIWVQTHFLIPQQNMWKKCCFSKCFKATNFDRFYLEEVSDFRQALTLRNKQCSAVFPPTTHNPYMYNTKHICTIQNIIRRLASWNPKYELSMKIEQVIFRFY